MAAASSFTSSFQVGPSAPSVPSISAAAPSFSQAISSFQVNFPASVAAASTSSFQVGCPASPASIAVASSSSTISFQVSHPPPLAPPVSAPPAVAASSSTVSLPVVPPAPPAHPRQIMTYAQLVAARAALSPFPVSFFC